jgi:hypothetical protein
LFRFTSEWWVASQQNVRQHSHRPANITTLVVTKFHTYLA